MLQFQYLDKDKKIVNPRITKQRIKKEILNAIQMRSIEGLHLYRLPNKKYFIFTDRMILEEEYMKFSLEENQSHYFLGIVRTPKKKQEIMYCLPIGELVASGKDNYILPPNGKINVQIKLN